MRNSDLKHRNNFITSVTKQIKKDYMAWIMLLPALICYIVYVWQPLASGIFLSFFKTQGFEKVAFAGFDNFKKVLTDSLFLKSFTNSVVYTIWALIIGGIVPIVLAIFINEMVHIKKFFTAVVYLPCMLPMIVASVMWKIMFDPSDAGLFNTILNRFGLESLQWLQDTKMTIPLIMLTIQWGGIGSRVILYIANLQSVSTDLYEAASIDGAGFWSKVKNITLPHMSGLIKMLIVMQILGVFKLFQQPLTMTGGGPNNATTTLMMLAYNKAFTELRVDEAAAISVIIMILLLIFTAIYFKLTKANNESGVA